MTIGTFLIGGFLIIFLLFWIAISRVNEEKDTLIEYFEIDLVDVIRNDGKIIDESLYHRAVEKAALLLYKARRIFYEIENLEDPITGVRCVDLIDNLLLDNKLDRDLININLFVITMTPEKKEELIDKYPQISERISSYIMESKRLQDILDLLMNKYPLKNKICNVFIGNAHIY